jgi:hypothetical protein
MRVHSFDLIAFLGLLVIHSRLRGLSKKLWRIQADCNHAKREQRLEDLGSFDFSHVCRCYFIEISFGLTHFFFIDYF